VVRARTVGQHLRARKSDTRAFCLRVYGYNGQFDLGDENASNNLFWTLNGEIV